jgi:putative ubiquitin-RnfH superfamily antitoxin RatB of RatAB toxin-antitoxin module
MAEQARKRCTVVYATPERQYEWSIELVADAPVSRALELARAEARALPIPWDTCDVGIFGQLCERTAVPHDGDRIELYRALASDPKEARRARARRARNRSGR